MSVVADTMDPPPTTRVVPTPGLRVVDTAVGWEHTAVSHTILLPTTGPRPASGWPVLVEYPGNYCGPGGAASATDCGSEWTMEGWGLGAATGTFIWLTLPFLTADLGSATASQLLWWGCETAGTMDTDPNCTNSSYTPIPTVNYTLDAVRQTLARFNGDADRVVVLGHSRGAIATQAIGGYNDEIAGLWAGMVAASHYDMPNIEEWPYSNTPLGGGVVGAVARAQRLANIPKLLVGECNLALLALGWIRANNVSISRATAHATGFRDHTGFWVARPSPWGGRDLARQWIAQLAPRGS